MAGNSGIEKIKQKIREFSTYSLFIEFELGIDENGNAAYTFTTGEGKSYYMSLDNQRTGTGYANVITITLAFAPDPDGNNVMDLNLYDLMLNFESLSCTVKYGYIFPDSEIISSPKYDVTVSDYKIEIQNGLLIYTITTYSGAADKKEFTLKFNSTYLFKINNGYDLIRAIDSGLFESLGMDFGGFSLKNPIGLAFYLLYSALGKEYDIIVDASIEENPPVDFSIVGTTDLTSDDGSTEESEPEPFNKAKKYQHLYMTSKDISNTCVNLSNFNFGAPLFNAIKEVLNAARCEGQEEMNPTTNEDDDEEKDFELITYTFLIDDSISESKPKKTITLCAENAPIKSDQKLETLAFYWMSGELDDIVMNFSPQFNGAAARAITQSVIAEEQQAKKENDSSGARGHAGRNRKAAKKGKLSDLYSVDSNGKVTPLIDNAYKDVFKPISGNTAYKDALATTTIFEAFSKYIYNASMTTIGIPTDINILDYFEIYPLIYGNPHHSAGIYRVTSIHDIVSSSGYTTDFELVKINSSSQFKKAISNLVEKRLNSNDSNETIDLYDESKEDFNWSSLLDKKYIESHK